MIVLHKFLPGILSMEINGLRAKLRKSNTMSRSLRLWILIIMKKKISLPPEDGCTHFINVY